VAVFGAHGAELQEFDPIAHAGDAAGTGGRLTAPMPGKVIALLGQGGDVVEAGPAPGRDGGHEDGAHHPRRATAWWPSCLYAVGDQVATVRRAAGCQE
jgi:3-methylcrotonyl-CoA carboxylase alpha subunit